MFSKGHFGQVGISMVMSGMEYSGQYHRSQPTFQVTSRSSRDHGFNFSSSVRFEQPILVRSDESTRGMSTSIPNSSLVNLADDFNHSLARMFRHI